MKKLLLLLSVFCITQINAQITFQKTYGTANYSEEASSMVKTFDKGYIMIGTGFDSTVSQNKIYVVKTDSNRTVQWTKTYGAISLDRGNNINTTVDGGYIITGST